MRKLRIIVVVSFLAGGIIGCADGTNQTDDDLNTPTQETKEPSKDYIVLGKEIAQSTFKVLSGKLKTQLQEGGVEQALPFCNVNAIPVTDSLSKVYDSKIERVALGYRNPKNRIKGYDEKVYHEYTEELGNGKMVEPKLHTNENGQMVFYAPIILKAQCVVCHGKPMEEINENTLAKLNEFYPDDNATGFAEGDLRGLWKITFKN